MSTNKNKSNFYSNDEKYKLTILNKLGYEFVHISDISDIQQINYFDIQPCETIFELNSQIESIEHTLEELGYYKSQYSDSLTYLKLNIKIKNENSIFLSFILRKNYVD
jgi:hypothetical protein